MVDLIAGFALAEGIVRLAPHFDSLGVAVSDGLARLSP